MTTAPTPDPRDTPLPREAPDKTPDSSTDTRERQAPGHEGDPEVIEAPPAEPEPAEGAVAVDRGEAHLGATEAGG